MSLELLLRASRSPAPATGALELRHDVARRHGRGRHLRPPRRRLRPLLASTTAGWSPTSRRCSTTRPCWPGVPARLAGHRRGPLPPGARRDDRLRAARPAPPGRRVLLGRGRRLATPTATARGRVLRLDAGRGARGARAPSWPPTAAAWCGVTEAGNFEGANILHRPVRGDLRAPAGGRGGPAPPVRGPGAAPAARPRRQGAHRVERPVPRHAGRGGGGHRRPASGSTPRSPTASSCWPTCGATTAAGCAPGRRDGGARHLALRRRPRRAGRRLHPLAEATGEARWIAEARADGRRAARPVLGRRPGRRCSPPATTPRRWSPARRTCWTTPRRRPTAWPPSACSPRRPHRRGRATRTTPTRSSRLLGPLTAQSPLAFGHLLAAVDLRRAGITEVAVVGDRPDLVDAVQRPLPAQRRAGLGRALRLAAVGGTRADGLAYVCRDYVVPGAGRRRSRPSSAQLSR